jgi:hypothetical protein
VEEEAAGYHNMVDKKALVTHRYKDNHPDRNPNADQDMNSKKKPKQMNSNATNPASNYPLSNFDPPSITSIL